jgi:hypothetical protein
MEVILWVFAALWIFFNLAVICIIISEGGNGLELSRDMTIGHILVAIFILPIAVIVTNLLNTSPWACFCRKLDDVMSYQPFKKKK